MDPISTGLAGIALVQKSVEFIKSNINTANDIKDIAGAIDGLFAGEKQVQQERFGSKSLIGQTKDAASSVIDAKLAQEQMEEISILINNRFGYGTWRQIVNERAKRIQEEKERIAEAKRIKRKQREETIEFIKIGSIIMGSAITIIIIAAVLIKVLT
tara:strand:+ start:752 stop:1222 length:471 start_codon:yes stop_codon:yes gene_type:complete